MAKLKSKINSKYKAAPKRKLVNGGLEDSPYLSKTNYQAQDAPTTMLQNQFDANEQRKAQQMTAIYGNQLARELDYLGDLNAASEKRKQEEAKAAKEKQEAEKQKAVSTVSTGASTIGKDLLKSAMAPTTVSAAGYTSPVWTSTAPAITAQSAGYAAPTLVDPAMQATTSTVGELLPNAVPVGPNAATMTTTGTNTANVAKTAGSMSNLAAAGASLGFIAAGEGVGYLATERQRKKDDAAKRSQYYRDTNYTNREALGQIGKSTLKGAGYGVTVGNAVPGIGHLIGGLTGATMGAAVGTGIAAKELYDTKGVKVFGKQYGAKDKYDENLDPTVIEKRLAAERTAALANTANAMENARMSSMTQSDLNTGFALKNSTFEVKYGGNIKYLKGGVAKSIGRGAVEYVGKKHEQGGIDLPGNIEVEGGETEQNDYVFSATLKLPNGETYAQAHKNLLKSGAPGQVIHQLALSQEAAAGRNPNQIKSMKFAKYGGPLRYDDGGKKDPITQDKIISIITSSGLSAEEFAKQVGVDPELIKGIQAGTINLNQDEQEMLLAAIPSTPATTTDNNPPADQTVTNTDTNNTNTEPKANPTYNTYNMPYQHTATEKGKLDYSDPNVAGGIWAGDKYEKEWKPLVSGTMADAAKANKVISYLESYDGQDAADVKSKIANKTREEKIAIINRLATDNKVGPFHNAVLQGINTTIEPPEPIKETTKDDDKTYIGNDLNEVVITGKREKLPPLPEYRDPNIGWVQAIPATMAMFSNIKPANYSPTLTSSYAQPGAVGRINLGRVSYNAERAANQQNVAAMNQALQNMSGPGAVAGMMAAKTKADQQALQIAQAEQNTNMARAGEEAKVNAGISQFNVGQAMQAQAENNRIGMYNAEMMNKANAFNTTARMQADMYNLETKLGAGEKVASTVIQSKKDADTLKATNRLANAMDYSKSLYRDDTFATLKKASQDPNNTDFYGKTDAELMDYAIKYSKKMYGDMGNVVTTATANTEETKKKFGGVKKYVSRLGDLKNNRTFKA